MKRILKMFILIMFVILLTACQNKPGPSPDPDPIVDPDPPIVVEEKIKLSLNIEIGSGKLDDPYKVEMFEDQLVVRKITNDKNIPIDIVITGVDGSGNKLPADHVYSTETRHREPNDMIFKALKLGQDLYEISQLNDKIYVLVIIKEKVIDKMDSLKVLAIGNSFSEDSLRYLWEIANDYGIEEVVIAHLVIGGTNLQQHWTNAANNYESYSFVVNEAGEWKRHSNANIDGKSTIKNGLNSDDWDFITVQQVSGLSGVASTYEPYLTQLVNYIKAESPKAKILFHMSWAYQQDSTHGDFPRYDNDQLKMYQAIVSAYQEVVAPNDLINGVIQTGTAIQNARTSYLGDTLTRDGFHLSYDKGRFLAGLNWFAAITGYDVNLISYTPVGVTIQDLKIFTEAVMAAQETPFEITQSTYN